MSPQYRAIAENTTFGSGGDHGIPTNNPCSSPSAVAEVAWAADASFALHKIESSTSQVEHASNNPLGDLNYLSPSSSLRKRASDYLASTQAKDSSKPFLSSYGSAFLSGIFADIAEVSGQQGPQIDDSVHDESVSQVVVADDDDDEPTDDFESLQPCKKKSRTSPPTLFGGLKKSQAALSGLTEGAVSAVSSPTVVSPRPKKSAIKIQLFNDQVRELQNLAFPSLPHMPVTVSSSSCTSSNIVNVVTPRDVAVDATAESDSEGSAYGWFVSTDDDDDNVSGDIPDVSLKSYLPSNDCDLAFKASTAPKAENQDVEVQQALAADTIDDVLGDFF